MRRMDGGKEEGMKRQRDGGWYKEWLKRGGRNEEGMKGCNKG